MHFLAPANTINPVATYTHFHNQSYVQWPPIKSIILEHTLNKERRGVGREWKSGGNKENGGGGGEKGSKERHKPHEIQQYNHPVFVPLSNQTV